jgi:hypothetical protein
MVRFIGANDNLSPCVLHGINRATKTLWKNKTATSGNSRSPTFCSVYKGAIAPSCRGLRRDD